jgi:hypothetical protein
MVDWKINQQIFKLLGRKTDILGEHVHDIKDGGTELIEHQFYDMDTIWVPAKSYCVALVYAHALSNDFGGTPDIYLRDPELLVDDKYFVPYDQDSATYDKFLHDTTWLDSPMADRILHYYRQEIFLEGFENE